MKCCILQGMRFLPFRFCLMTLFLFHCPQQPIRIFGFCKKVFHWIDHPSIFFSWQHTESYMFFTCGSSTTPKKLNDNGTIGHLCPSIIVDGHFLNRHVQMCFRISSVKKLNMQPMEAAGRNLSSFPCHQFQIKSANPQKKFLVI